MATVVGICVMGALGAATSAHAELGLYVGGTAGQHSISYDVKGRDGTLDGNAVAFTLLAGFRYGRYVALETGYFDLGAIETASGAYAMTQSAWGVSATLLAKAPLGPVDLFGRIGAVSWRGDYSNIVSLSLPTQRSGVNAAYGAGVAVNLGRVALRVQGDYMDAKDLGHPIVGTAGLTFRF